MARKVIGYQIANRALCEVPEGLLDFQVFRDLEMAREYLFNYVPEKDREKFLINRVREGDIEEPTFIESLSQIV